jgi:hypothetical protein
MGYRSQVRSLIYGDPDVVNALVVSQQLLGFDAQEAFGENLKRYRIQRRFFDHAASAELGPDPDNGRAQIVWRDVEVEVLDLYGDDWKWYEDYTDVKAWTQMMGDAIDLGLCREFVRIGEDTEDTEWLMDIPDEGDHYLRVERSIGDDVPEPIEAQVTGE